MKKSMSLRCTVSALLLVLGSSAALFAQQEVGDPLWGFTFRVPPGWIYQQTDEGVVLGHNSVPGLIMVLPHLSSSMEQIRAEMQSGMVEEGMELYPAGSLGSLGSNILAGEYQGVFQFQQVRARCVGTLSPHGGGAYVIALITPEQYGPGISGPADAIAKSMRYTRVESEGLASHFAGTWVHYSPNGQATVVLAPGGEFSFRDERSYSGNLSDGTFSTGTWGAYGESSEQGRWSVRGDKRKGTIILSYPDGSREYVGYQVFVEHGQVYWGEYLFDGDHYRKESP